MRNDNWGSNADYSHQNWTGRFHRQSRITGQWSANRRNAPPLWDVVATLLGAIAILFAVML